MIKTIQKGFTLIELMIVVAIIAILAAIAIPAYQDYLIRSQVSEGASLASGAKTAVAEYYANYGVAPANNAAAGLETDTNINGTYVTKVTVAGGVVSAFYGNKANKAILSKSLVFTPALAGQGSTKWTCTGNGIAAKYLPSACRP